MFDSDDKKNNKQIPMRKIIQVLFFKFKDESETKWQIKNNSDESVLWQYIHKYFNTKTNSNKSNYANRDHELIAGIDFEGIEIDGSELFRLLGKWQLNYPLFPLIIYNIHKDVFSQLIRINTSYYEQQGGKNDLPFWNESAVVIVYSYFKTQEDARFYFTDVLWGKKRIEFLVANYLVGKINAGLNSLYIDDYKNNMVIANDEIKDDVDLNEFFNNKDKSIIEDDIIKKLQPFGIFHKGKTLLPYDVLLANSNGFSLFEENTMFLLKRELDLNKGF
jgi:hypothetical protein